MILVLIFAYFSIVENGVNMGSFLLGKGLQKMEIVMKKQLLVMALLSASVLNVEATNLNKDSADDHALAYITVADLSDYARAADRNYKALYSPVKSIADRNLKIGDCETQSVAQYTLAAFRDFVDTKQGSDLAKSSAKCTPSVLNVAAARLMKDDPIAVTQAIAGL